MTILHSITTPAAELPVLGEEPTWNSLYDEGADDGVVTVTDKNYRTQLGRGLNWHNSVADKDDYPLNIGEWISAFRPKTSKKDLATWKHNASKVKGYATIASLARMACQGFPLNSKDRLTVETFILEHIKAKVVEAKEEKKVERVSVQDRMKDQIRPVLSNLDEAIDRAFDGKKIDVTAIKTDILRPEFKAPHLGLIQQYLDNNIGEWVSAYDRLDEQLVEGYAYCPRKRLKTIIDAFVDVRSALDKQASVIRVRKIMKKKPTDKKKVVKSLKYLKAFPELGLTSISPVDVLGTTVVWVYDTNKKKVGYYHAEVEGGLFVKGTTILGTRECSQKTIRKPKEQLAIFGKLRKNQIVNWFEAIRSKELPLKGRTNDNLVILRAD